MKILRNLLIGFILSLIPISLFADTITSGIGLLLPTTGVYDTRSAADKYNKNFIILASSINTLANNPTGSNSAQSTGVWINGQLMSSVTFTGTGQTVTFNGSTATVNILSGGGGGGALVFQNPINGSLFPISTFTTLGDIQFWLQGTSIALKVDMSTITTRLGNLDASTATLNAKFGDVSGSTTTRLNNLDNSTATLNNKFNSISSGVYVNAVFVSSINFAGSGQSLAFNGGTVTVTITGGGAGGGGGSLSIRESSGATLYAGVSSITFLSPISVQMFSSSANVTILSTATLTVSSISASNVSGGTVTATNIILGSYLLQVLPSSSILQYAATYYDNIPAGQGSALSISVGGTKLFEIGDTTVGIPALLTASSLTVTNSSTSFNGVSYKWPNSLTGGNCLQVAANGSLSWATCGSGGGGGSGSFRVYKDTVDQSINASSVNYNTTNGLGVTIYSSSITLDISPVGTIKNSSMTANNVSGSTVTAGKFILNGQPAVLVLSTTVLQNNNTYYWFTQNNGQGRFVSFSIDATTFFEIDGSSVNLPWQTFISSLSVINSSFSIAGIPYKWPLAQATPNQVLSNNGAGTLSWVAQSGGGGGGGGSFRVYKDTVDQSVNSSTVNINTSNGLGLTVYTSSITLDISPVGTIKNSSTTANNISGSTVVAGTLIVNGQQAVLLLSTTVLQNNSTYYWFTQNNGQGRFISFSIDATTFFEIDSSSVNIPWQLFTSSVNIKVGSITINQVPYLFPSIQGSANQVLSNNGNGVLSWVTSSGGGGSATASLNFSSQSAGGYVTISSMTVKSFNGYNLVTVNTSSTTVDLTNVGVILASQTWSGSPTFVSSLTVLGTNANAFGLIRQTGNGASPLLNFTSKGGGISNTMGIFNQSASNQYGTLIIYSDLGGAGATSPIATFGGAGSGAGIGSSGGLWLAPPTVLSDPGSAFKVTGATFIVQGGAVESNNGFVGIGTFNPTTKFHIVDGSMTMSGANVIADIQGLVKASSFSVTGTSISLGGIDYLVPTVSPVGSMALVSNAAGVMTWTSVAPATLVTKVANLDSSTATLTTRINSVASSTGITTNGTLISSIVFTGAGQSVAFNGATVTVTINGVAIGDVSGTTTTRLNNLDYSTSVLTSLITNIVSTNIANGAVASADLATNLTISSLNVTGTITSTSGVIVGSFTAQNLSTFNGNVNISSSLTVLGELHSNVTAYWQFSAPNLFSSTAALASFSTNTYFGQAIFDNNTSSGAGNWTRYYWVVSSGTTFNSDPVLDPFSIVSTTSTDTGVLDFVIAIGTISSGQNGRTVTTEHQIEFTTFTNSNGPETLRMANRVILTGWASTISSAGGIYVIQLARSTNGDTSVVNCASQPFQITGSIKQ